MDRRLLLQALLEAMVPNVYYQPPSNVAMQYPAIVYELDDINTEFAGNLPYRQTKRYQVTIMSRSPLTPLVDQVAALPTCSFSRAFAADNLNHFIFSLYF